MLKILGVKTIPRYIGALEMFARVILLKLSLRTNFNENLPTVDASKHSVQVSGFTPTLQSLSARFN